jgi:Ca2+-binding EF-hand superfamily protein
MLAADGLMRSLPAFAVTFVLSLPAFAALSTFEAMDADRDGQISAGEHAAAARRMFTLMDADRDGKVTAAEMEAAQEKVSGAAGSSAPSASDKIMVVDPDRDGVLTIPEHAAASRAMFRQMDTDKDGTLSKAELDAGHALLKKAK